MYHYVRDGARVHARTTAELEAQLDHVAANYSVVDLDTARLLLACLEALPGSRRAIAATALAELCDEVELPEAATRLHAFADRQRILGWSHHDRLHGWHLGWK